jgi:hypothetical protein
MCIKGKNWNSQKGQTLIEYIFLLAIVVMVVLGVAYRFNSGFADFADKFFGNEDSYVACLIKEGLLPGDAGGKCERPQLDFQAGKKIPLSAGGGNRPNTPSTLGTTKTAGAAQNPKPIESGASRAGENNHSIPVGKFGGNSGKYIGDSTQSGGAGSPPQQNSSGSGKVSAGGINTDTASKEQQDLRARNVPFSKGDKLGDKKGDDNIPFGDRDRKTSREIAEEKKKKAQSKDLETELSFGKIFRYLIIAALIFGIIFFVGSQFVAVSRGNKR